MSLDVLLIEEDGVVHEANITHNVRRMAVRVYLHCLLWELAAGGAAASSLIEPLETGLRIMNERPEWVKKAEPANKWGTYEDFKAFLEALLAACKEYPTATYRAFP